MIKITHHQYAINNLIVKNALKVQKKYRHALTQEEAIQVGWLACLVRIESGFDRVDRRKNLEAIAKRVRGSITDYVHTISGFKRDHNTCKIVYLEEIADAKDHIDDLCVLPETDSYEKYTINDLVYVLADTDKEIIVRVYSGGETLSEIAKHYKITERNIVDKLLGAHKRLRATLNKNDFF